jgi:hypothetical protein
MPSHIPNCSFDGPIDGEFGVVEHSLLEIELAQNARWGALCKSK